MIRSTLVATLMGALAVVVGCTRPPSEGEAPSAEAVRSAVLQKLEQTLAANDGSIELVEEGAEEGIELTVERVHDDIEHVACVDFTAPDGTPFDVDFYLAGRDGALHVERIRLHKVGSETVEPAGVRVRIESLP